MTYIKNPTILALLIIGLIFSLNVNRAIDLRMNKNPSLWAVNAIPPVISKMYFGEKRNYVSLKEVQTSFFDQYNSFDRDPERLNSIIEKIQNTPLKDPHSYELLGNDDKGIVDFVYIAFKVFGAKTDSIIYLYFLVLGVSCAIFIGEFHRSLPSMFLLACILTMFYLIMPSIKYNPQSISFMALRIFPLLSIVACLHCLCYLLPPSQNNESQKFYKSEIIFSAIQLAIIYFTIHIRTTTMWQLYIIAGTAAFLLMLEGYKYIIRKTNTELNIKAKVYKFSSILGIILAGYFALQGFRAWSFPEEYKNGQQILTRVFWHNIFSGFSFHPMLADKYQLRIDDLSIYDATGEYLKEKNRIQDWENIAGPNNYNLRWAEYDKIVLDMLKDRCTQYPMECVSTFLYYKPISFIGNLSWLYGLRSYPPDLDIFVSKHFGDIVKRQFIETTHSMDAKHQRVYLFSSLVPYFIIFPFIILLVFGKNKSSLNSSLKVISLIFIGSLTTMIVGYPGAHTITECALIFGALIYVLIASLAYNLLAKPRAARI